MAGLPALTYITPTAEQRKRERQARAIAAAAAEQAALRVLVEGRGQHAALAPALPLPPSAGAQMGAPSPLPLPPTAATGEMLPPLRLPSPQMAAGVVTGDQNQGPPIPRPVASAAPPPRPFAQGGQVGDAGSLPWPEGVPDPPADDERLPFVVGADEIMQMVRGRMAAAPVDATEAHPGASMPPAAINEDTIPPPPAFVAWLKTGQAEGSELGQDLLDLYADDPSLAGRLWQIAQRLAMAEPELLPEALRAVVREEGGDAEPVRARASGFA